MYACAIEIYNDRIYDLLQGVASDKFEIVKDYFGMTLVKHAEYKECLTDEEVRSAFTKAVSNRPAAHEALRSEDSNFVSILTVQTYNKFQHRYTKGKITHLKLASLSKNKETIQELESLSRGQQINYNKNYLLKLLRDCFGGNAKTCVLACVNSSESNINDTVATMKLVSGMKRITNEISKNMDSEEGFKLKNNIERMLRGQKPEFL